MAEHTDTTEGSALAPLSEASVNPLNNAPDVAALGEEMSRLGTEAEGTASRKEQIFTRDPSRRMIPAEELVQQYPEARVKYWDDFSEVFRSARSKLRTIEAKGSKRSEEYLKEWEDLRWPFYHQNPLVTHREECHYASFSAGESGKRLEQMQMEMLKNLVQNDENLFATLCETLLAPEDLEVMTDDSSRLLSPSDVDDSDDEHAAVTIAEVFRKSALDRKGFDRAPPLRDAISCRELPKGLEGPQNPASWTTLRDATDETKWGILMSHDSATGAWNATFMATVPALPDCKVGFDDLTHINKNTPAAGQDFNWKLLTASIDETTLEKISKAVENAVTSAHATYKSYSERLEQGCALLIKGAPALGTQGAISVEANTADGEGVDPNAAEIRKLDDLADREELSWSCNERLPRMVLDVCREIEEEIRSAHAAAREKLDAIIQSDEVSSDLTGVIRNVLNWTERAMNPLPYHHRVHGVLYSQDPDSYRHLEKDEPLPEGFETRIGPVWTKYNPLDHGDDATRKALASDLDKDVKAHLSKSRAQREEWTEYAVKHAGELDGLEAKLSLFSENPLLASITSELVYHAKRGSEQDQATAPAVGDKLETMEP